MGSNEPQFCEDRGTCICGNDCLNPNNLSFEENVALFDLFKAVGLKDGEQPTPDQLVTVWQAATPRQLRHMAVVALNNAENAVMCIQSGHQGAVEFARNHVCEDVEAAYQRGADDFAKALQLELDNSHKREN